MPRRNYQPGATGEWICTVAYNPRILLGTAASNIRDLLAEITAVAGEAVEGITEEGLEVVKVDRRTPIRRGLRF